MISVKNVGIFTKYFSIGIIDCSWKNYYKAYYGNDTLKKVKIERKQRKSLKVVKEQRKMCENN